MLKTLRFPLLLSLFWLGVSGFFTTQVEAQRYPGTVSNQADALIYTPSGMEAHQRYPVLVAFAPNGDAAFLVRFWQPFCEQHRWILYASKEYRNHRDMNRLYPQVKASLEDAFATFPIDTSRVVMSGMSGGGSFAQAMSLEYPGLVSALIVNTGRIWDDVYARAYEARKGLPARYGRSRRLVVFLASPTDFRYEEMKRDALLLQHLGWRTHWLEFRGGHTYAPKATYTEALQWLTTQPSWQ